MPPVDLAALKAAVAAITAHQHKKEAMGWVVAWSPEVGEWFALNGFDPGADNGFGRKHWYTADESARLEHSVPGAQGRLNKWQRERRPSEVGGPTWRNGWSLESHLEEATERAELAGWKRIY